MTTSLADSRQQRRAAVPIAERARAMRAIGDGRILPILREVLRGVERFGAMPA